VIEPAIVRDIRRERGAASLVVLLAVVVPGLILAAVGWDVLTGPHHGGDVPYLASLALAYAAFDVAPSL
jgi:hypothetical protein